jgi:hypothetical protein
MHGEAYEQIFIGIFCVILIEKCYFKRSWDQCKNKIIRQIIVTEYIRIPVNLTLLIQSLRCEDFEIYDRNSPKGPLSFTRLYVALNVDCNTEEFKAFANRSVVLIWI